MIIGKRFRLNRHFLSRLALGQMAGIAIHPETILQVRNGNRRNTSVKSAVVVHFILPSNHTLGQHLPLFA